MATTETASFPWRARLGALTERDYRLLFSATTITTIGDRIAGIALSSHSRASVPTTLSARSC